MSPFWNSLCEHLRNCGRDATLFILTLGGVAALAGLAAISSEVNLQEYLLPALPGIFLLALLWVRAAARRARARRRQRLHRAPLSRDELRVARSKLVKDANQASRLWVLL